MLRRTLSFFHENGAYILFSSLAELPAQLLRDHLLAKRFGVRKLHIGPRAHLRGLTSIHMGEDFSAGRSLWLEAITSYAEERFTPRITIGNHVRISNWSHIACTHSIYIGDHAMIGSKVLITDHNHGSFAEDATSPNIPPSNRRLERNRSVIIGAKVWLGDGVVVCPGVTMGEGSIAGANAVVTCDVPPFTLVAGVPARPLRRYDQCREKWIRV